MAFQRGGALSCSPPISENQLLLEEHTRRIVNQIPVSCCPQHPRNVEGTPLHSSMSVARPSLTISSCMEPPRPPRLLCPDIHAPKGQSAAKHHLGGWLSSPLALPKGQHAWKGNPRLQGALRGLSSSSPGLPLGHTIAPFYR